MQYSSTSSFKKKKKIYKQRSSLYDHLTESNPYIHGFYNACTAQLILFTIFIVLRDSYRAQSFQVNVLSKAPLLLGGAKDWLVFTGLECAQLVGFFLLYYAFQVWIKLRRLSAAVANFLFFTFFLIYPSTTFYLVWQTVNSLHLSSIPRLIAFVEQIRLCMKGYSFIRENAYKVLYPWSKDDKFGPAEWYAGQMSPRVASFSQYLYFLFAPTFLYRDHYPRNKGPINWKNVLLYAIQFVWVLFASQVIFMEVLFPKSMKLDDLVDSYLVCLLVSPLMYFLCSIIVFHAWFNFTAELTRFADREFYLNWWSAVDYSEFYRTWNVQVYDYLVTYIYQDLRSLVGYRTLAGLPAIVISALLHDFLTGIGMGFFLPVFVILFAFIGGIVYLLGIRFTKLVTFIFTCVGYTIFQSCYLTEIAARVYCYQDDMGYITWKTWECFYSDNS